MSSSGSSERGDFSDLEEETLRQEQMQAAAVNRPQGRPKGKKDKPRSSDAPRRGRPPQRANVDEQTMSGDEYDQMDLDLQNEDFEMLDLIAKRSYGRSETAAAVQHAAEEAVHSAPDVPSTSCSGQLAFA